MKDDQGFTWVQQKKRGERWQEAPKPTKRLSTTNKFAILDEPEKKDDTLEAIEEHNEKLSEKARDLEEWKEDTATS